MLVVPAVSLSVSVVGVVVVAMSGFPVGLVVMSVSLVVVTMSPVVTSDIDVLPEHTHILSAADLHNYII